MAQRVEINAHGSFFQPSSGVSTGMVFWSVPLTDADVRALANGADPAAIQSEFIVAEMPAATVVRQDANPIAADVTVTFSGSN